MILSRRPRLRTIEWEGGTLLGNSLGEVFQEVSAFVSRDDFDKIYFTLGSLQREQRWSVGKGDNDKYKRMRRAFNESVKEDRKKDTINFEISLEASGEQRIVDIGNGLSDDDEVFT